MVSVDRLRKVYKSGKVEMTALHDVSLKIDTRDFVVFAGPSGSGKTTLLNLIGGLDTPDGGNILIDGQDITKMRQGRMSVFRKEKLGFIFQSFNLIQTLTAYENVELPLLLNKVPKSVRAEKVDRILNEVGIQSKKHNYPREMSGGQQQRVAVARALVGEPLLVLADEPTANLDSKSGADVIRLLKELNKSLKVTIILSTHDTGIIEAIPHVVRLKDGAIVK
jgi:putative ABC transport system ATP-binding protein